MSVRRLHRSGPASLPISSRLRRPSFAQAGTGRRLRGRLRDAVGVGVGARERRRRSVGDGRCSAVRRRRRARRGSGGRLLGRDRLARSAPARSWARGWSTRRRRRRRRARRRSQRVARLHLHVADRPVERHAGDEDDPQKERGGHPHPASDRASRPTQALGVEDRCQVVGEERALEDEECRDAPRAPGPGPGPPSGRPKPGRGKADQDPEHDDRRERQEHAAPSPPQGRLPQAGQEERERGRDPCAREPVMAWAPPGTDGVSGGRDRAPAT